MTGRMRLPLPPRPSIRAPERKAAPKDGLLWEAPTEDAHVPESDDEAQAFKRLLFNKRKRTLLHLMRMLEAKAATMAHQATCARRRRRGPQGQPKAFNPVAELRKEIMPMIGELMRVAGGADSAQAPKARKPKRRRSRRDIADKNP